ncbi:MAG: helix-turn-helix domain-containing protein, partial [Synergistaceae bacterium]|nr:helix-turn-helix domain-containing protein [Synergistaceae bacterium]
LDSQYYLAAAIKSEKGADLRADIESVFDTSCFLAVETEHDEYGIIAQSNDAGRIEEKTMNLLSSLMKRAARQTGATLHAGVGMTVEHLHELGHSFREAETACNYAIFTGLSNPCLINSVKTDTVGFGLAEHLARAREFFLCGNQEEIEDFTKRLKNSALKGVATHYAYIDVLMTAARTLREMSASPEELLPELSMIGESAFSIDNPEELEAAVAKICERVILFRKKYLSNRRYKLVADAKQFIDGNFSDPELSLQKAASAAHVSPTYFSAVFSRETGETLSDYITRVRVKNAMKILKTTTLSASEVSAMVGFNDPLYFSRVFKRAVGVNVSEFRKK